MNKPNIQTTKQVVPMLYGYSTPEVVRHNGWTKIGYTEQDVETRINQQTHTADIKWQLEWKGNATFDDGSGETFIDKDFHAYLRNSGIEQEKGKNNEWFHVDGATSKQMFRDFREDHGILKTTDTVIPYKLREEQQSAHAMTDQNQATHKNQQNLKNAKPTNRKTKTKKQPNFSKAYNIAFSISFFSFIVVRSFFRNDVLWLDIRQWLYKGFRR